MTRQLRATLGGAFLPGRKSKAFRAAYANIGYVFIDLPDGDRLQLFYNAERRLFVADVIHKSEKRGNEFVRVTVPQP